MKKYVSPSIEISIALDVIATSAEVTTGGIKLPWTTGENASSYELLSFRRMDSSKDNYYAL